MSKGEVRIIGGQWRSRKIGVPTIEGLRPTPDSVRETVFNWLQPHIIGARCLDLFSGTGVMAFEALSRGASQVTMVEHSKVVCKNLHSSAEKLQAESGSYHIIQQEVIHWLTHVKPSKSIKSDDNAPFFNLVFVDPPYHKDWLTKVMPLLFARTDLLSSNCLVYVESEKALAPALLSHGAEVIKHKKAGCVYYSLVSVVR